MITNIILILVAVVSIIFAGLFSGAETGIYQLSRIRLRIGAEQKRLPYIVLSKIMSDSPALLLSTLIVTNLAYYIVTSIVTAMLLGNLDTAYSAELFATLIITPTLFIFSELIPKNIFFYYADTLMPPVSFILFIFHKLFTWCGLIGLLKFISRIFAQLTGSPIPSKTAITAVRQSHIKAICKETHEEGFLSPIQTDIINRLTEISHLSIKSVMTPIGKTQILSQNSDYHALLKTLKKSPFTRLPVYYLSHDNIIGFVNIYDCLSSKETFTDLHRFLSPIRKLGADTTVSDAINIMQSENQKIVLVTKAMHSHREKPIGIVTMKDLVEELVGELAEW